MRFILSLFLLTVSFSCAFEARSQRSSSKDSPVEQADTTTVPEADVAYLTGKFEPAEHPDFVQIELPYASTSGMYLRKEAYEAFVRMHEAAKKDGVQLVIISATRNFARQKSIWEAKWDGKRKTSGVGDIKAEYPDPAERALKILEYSSMPGTSRHHWGTDIDLNNLENSYFAYGTGKKIYNWLIKHAHEYGYCQVYTPKGPDRLHGYNEEKWHWSYTPLSAPFTDTAERVLTDKMISGFDGDDAAVMIGVVNKFVLGVNKECR